MNEWLISINYDSFKINECFSKYGYIDYGLNNDQMKIGDVVYIYLTASNDLLYSKKIGYKTEVICNRLKEKEEIDDLEFLTANYKKSFTKYKVRLKLKEEFLNNQMLYYDTIKNNVKNIPFSFRGGTYNLTCKYKELLDYINICLARILFCNIAYYQYYDVEQKPEIGINGGSFVKENGRGFEENNFHICDDGYVRGYVEVGNSGGYKNKSSSRKTIHIENIDVHYLHKDKIDNVLVVFCAKKPNFGTVIIGWYKNATVYRNTIETDKYFYNIIVSASNINLLEEQDRIYLIPRASANVDRIGFGQSNVWYANSTKDKDVVYRTILYIKSREIFKEEEYQDEKFDSEISNINYKCYQIDKNETIKGPEKKKTKVVNDNTKQYYYPRDNKRSVKALYKSNFKCEINNNHNTFIRKSDGTPYMEPHHLIPIAYQDNFENSLDVEENIVSLCSNCHNEIHYGKNRMELIEYLYNKRKDFLKEKGIYITLEKLKEYYK